MGLGTNLGKDTAALRATLDATIAALHRVPHTRVASVSSFYLSPRVGEVSAEFLAIDDAQYAQAMTQDYLNCVVLLETELSAESLLGVAFGLEAAQGRLRPYPLAPRILDVDVLLVESVTANVFEQYDTAELILPHPRMWERAFVMLPLAEVWAEAVAGWDVPVGQEIKKLD